MQAAKPNPFGASAQAMQDLQEPIKIDTSEETKVQPLTFGPSKVTR